MLSSFGNGRRRNGPQLELVRLNRPLDVGRFGVRLSPALPTAAGGVVVGLVARERPARISRAAELRRIHSAGGHGAKRRSEVWGEESVEDRVEAGVAVGQTVSDDLKDDEAADLDVVDAETLQKQNYLIIKIKDFTIK